MSLFILICIVVVLCYLELTGKPAENKSSLITDMVVYNELDSGKSLFEAKVKANLFE